jgi:SNF2 family DNA or RNA helicase
MLESFSNMSSAEVLSAYYQFLQKACLPGVWSKGVALFRDGAVHLDAWTEKEITLRVKAQDRPISQKVNLWPGESAEDGDYFCNCDDRADPCAHVAAAVAALKNGLTLDSTPAIIEATLGTEKNSVVHYRFIRAGKTLLLKRSIGEFELTDSLIAYIAGVNAKRIAGPRIAATQDDFTIDQILSENKTYGLTRKTFTRLFKVLKAVSNLSLDGSDIQVGSSLSGFSAEIHEDERDHFRVRGIQDESITEVFENGVVLSGGVLRLIDEVSLTPDELRLLQPPGRKFSPAELPRLVTEILPALREKIPVKILSRNFPEPVSGESPRLELHLERATLGLSNNERELSQETLAVIPSIRYPSRFSIRNKEKEQSLERKIQNELQLSPGSRVELQGESAIEFIEKLRHFSGEKTVTGDGERFFTPENKLEVNFSGDEGPNGPIFDLSFSSGKGSSQNSSIPPKSASLSSVFRAWREGEHFVPLLEGGFSRLPLDWLEKYGTRIEKLLFWREENKGNLPPYFRPEILELAEESTGKISESLEKYRDALREIKKIPDPVLPSDLTVDLRNYQLDGVRWLTFLRESNMGALLADDMGLGKTLQAMCSIKGKTLVVCPTSVIHSWADQIQKFRPSLSVNRYTGSNRSLLNSADVILTSYGILRQDQEKLHAIEWESIVLDEAQNIKNPESQIARAAHQLKGKFRLTLSGTPVENSLEDLWSQFHFLNPGLLGTRAEFKAQYMGESTREDRSSDRASNLLRSRIKPFILRRLKKDVAPELPPRTEVVLECELSDDERNLYDSLVTAQRKEILEKLDSGASVFGALELLLRLRQASCHPSLIPGEKAEMSSKLELLLSSLDSSIAQSHRALVFSQWTSFLDIIEKEFKEKKITYLRLDGETRNREEIVRKFQAPDGPSVLLMSLKAGGVGLTLTAADHVFLMDSWWNPAVEEQAADRAHRIGQENPVLVSRLIAKNTVEEKILLLQKKKSSLSNQLLEGSAQSASLTREDILSLLT